MSQIEASKVVAYAATGSAANEASVSKVVAYLILSPGSIDTGPQGQGHVHTQVIRRR